MEALNEAQNAELAKVADAQLAAGGAFLKENGARDGVVTTASGLQYEIITVGDGPMPAATDTVITHYHGTLIDGTVFDSSVERGTPASFPVNGVIAGWVEALQLMPVGSKWRLFVPPGLAYGDRGAGGAIGPNETLIFEVELLEIKSS
jgi:FKBP-type peptidyl-prolyl cis-trans isomerase FklB